jgi:hypothetical protein
MLQNGSAAFVVVRAGLCSSFIDVASGVFAWVVAGLRLECALHQFLGVFVTREHVRHNKSGIAHRGRTGINHLRELPTKLNHFCSGGQVTLPNRTREPKVCL